MTTPNVVLDASPWHPTVVFFQDTATRFTIACERDSGEYLGVDIGNVRPGTREFYDVHTAVWHAVERYQAERGL